MFSDEAEPGLVDGDHKACVYGHVTVIQLSLQKGTKVLEARDFTIRGFLWFSGAVRRNGVMRVKQKHLSAIVNLGARKEEGNQEFYETLVSWVKDKKQGETVVIRYDVYCD